MRPPGNLKRRSKWARHVVPGHFAPRILGWFAPPPSCWGAGADVAGATADGLDMVAHSPDGGVLSICVPQVELKLLFRPWLTQQYGVGRGQPPAGRRLPAEG